MMVALTADDNAPNSGSGTTKYEKENVYIYKGGKWELFSGQLIAA